MWPQSDVDCLVNDIIRKLHNDSRLSDLVVRLKDGTAINAHKFVLAARSKVWYSQFLSSSSAVLNASSSNQSNLIASAITQSPPNSPDGILSNDLANKANLNPTGSNFITNNNNNSNKNFPDNNNHHHHQLGSTPPNQASPLARSNTLINSSNNTATSTSNQNELDFSDIDTDVGASIINWIYTGEFEFNQIFCDEMFIFGVLKTARKYKLQQLVKHCEKSMLEMAPEVGLDKIAKLLMEGHADINTTNKDGLTLLHLAVDQGDEKGAIYLINNGANLKIKTPSNQTIMEMAIRQKLTSVVRVLCHKDNDLKNTKCSNDDTPLWFALVSGEENIASILVEFGCDTNCWEEVPSKYSQNLLHRALDRSDQKTACFLIRAGCDCNSPRGPLENGEGDDEAFDGQTPLHIACAWNMKEVVQTLLEHHADINAQDAEGRTPLHVAIANQDEVITRILVAEEQLDLTLRDKYGSNPFALAMSTKFNQAASIILNREPHAAEKYDLKGRTFLHIAIQNNDFESVLFLLSVHVNINSRVQDSSKFSPIHLAVQAGSEMILRNLILAGANINDLTIQGQTALHIAADNDHHQLCSILLENNINYDINDSDLNNALHLACQRGNLNSCRVLLTESRINAVAQNLRGHNPIHLLALNGKENAHAILDCFMQCMPEYPINAQDGEGNTALLIAYKNGNANLCRSLIRHGACLGSTNKSNINIFNAQVASKNLLYRLLEYLPQEPPWTDGDSCLECSSKFGLTNRKHHCRHCGRILCAKCSPRELAINKFKSPKPVRVCSVCAEVLTYGENH